MFSRFLCPALFPAGSRASLYEIPAYPARTAVRHAALFAFQLWRQNQRDAKYAKRACPPNKFFGRRAGMTVVLFRLRNITE